MLLKVFSFVIMVHNFLPPPSHCSALIVMRAFVVVALPGGSCLQAPFCQSTNHKARGQTKSVFLDTWDCGHAPPQAPRYLEVPGRERNTTWPYKFWSLLELHPTVIPRGINSMMHRCVSLESSIKSQPTLATESSISECFRPLDFCSSHWQELPKQSLYCTIQFMY